MPAQIDVYNSALLVCGERSLVSLTENREPRRLLDQVWSAGGVNACLEDGQWFFAMRTIQIDYDTSIEPSYGYQYAFVKPDDWVLTSAVCEDEYFRSPSTRHVDEAGLWYSDLQTLYIRYVSNDPNYGMNMNKWPQSFVDFVGAHFAWKIVRKLTGSGDDEDRVEKIRMKLKEEAKNRGMMAEPSTFPARGSWGLSRNRFPNRRDGGNLNGPLIG